MMIGVVRTPTPAPVRQPALTGHKVLQTTARMNLGRRCAPLSPPPVVAAVRGTMEQEPPQPIQLQPPRLQQPPKIQVVSPPVLVQPSAPMRLTTIPRFSDSPSFSTKPKDLDHCLPTTGFLGEVTPALGTRAIRERTSQEATMMLETTSSSATLWQEP